MNLLLITGFLGSGKTTCVVNLAKAAIHSGKRVAILVNEIGEIGIDNKLMRQLDFNVWELTNGCICCSLSGDLITTLETLSEGYQPDLIIVEPSGAADPRIILKTLPLYKGKPLSQIKTAAIVDPLRFEILLEVMTPLVTGYIQLADLILIGKADLATPEELASTEQKITDINNGIKIFPVDLRDLQESVIQEILS